MDADCDPSDLHTSPEFLHVPRPLRSAGWSALEGWLVNIIYLLIGAVLLLLVVIDLLWTTLWVDGGSGPLLARLTTWLWRGLRTIGGKRSRTLSLAGPLMLIASLMMWVVLLWAGWTFLFAGGDGALIDAQDGDRVTWSARIYFVGYSMFTMGNGDYIPKDGFWQIATGFTTASGMLFVTLGVSYVLSVLGAVAQKRSFASAVTGLGMSGESIAAVGWDGDRSRSLDLPLSMLSSQLDLLADQHNTYPILHYYHSEGHQTASSVAVAILDEALTLLRFGVQDDKRPNAAVLRGARSSVESYLRTLNSAFIQPADHAPPPPDLQRIRSAGLPVVDDLEFAERLRRLEDRRRKLLGMVHADAWPWPERISMEDDT